MKNYHFIYLLDLVYISGYAQIGGAAVTVTTTSSTISTISAEEVSFIKAFIVLNSIAIIHQ